VPALLAAGVFCTTFGLFEERGEHAQQSDNEANADQCVAGHAPECGIAGRAELVCDVRKRENERDDGEEAKRGGEDVEVASHGAGTRILGEEFFDIGDVVGAAIGRQGVEECGAVAGGADAGVEQHEYSTVRERADEATEALLECEDGLRYL